MVSVQDSLKFFCVVFIILFTVVGCGNETADHANPAVGEGHFDPNSVSLTCSDPSRCTNSVGVILTVTTSTDYRWGYRTIQTSVSRCTGALYSPTQILTAGHCSRPIGTGRSFFRTVATAGKPSQTFEIKGVQKSFYDESETYSNDFAALELVTPAHGFDYVRPASFIAHDLKDVTALVVNQTSSDWKTLALDSVDCNVDTESMPLHIADYPSVWGTKSCKIVSGNSGGPVFARGNLSEVLGVFSKSTEANANRLTDPLIKLGYQRQRASGLNLASAGNAACFDLPGWPAPAPLCKTLNAESVRKISKERNRIALRQQLLNEVREFHKSSRSRIILGNAAVKMMPYPLVVYSSDYWSKKRKGIALIPHPVCVESGSLAAAEFKSLDALVFEVDEDSSDKPIKYSGDRITPSLKVAKLDSGKWRINYSFDNGRNVFRPDTSDALSLMTDGRQTELPACTGTEDTKMLEDLDKIL